VQICVYTKRQVQHNITDTHVTGAQLVQLRYNYTTKWCRRNGMALWH